MQELYQTIATRDLKANRDQWLKLLEEAQRLEVRNDANNSWVSSREMRERLAKRGVKDA